MFKLEFAHICEFASLQKNNRPTAAGIFSRVVVEDLPSTINRFHLIAQFESEGEGSAEIKVKLLDPEKENIKELKNKISATGSGRKSGMILDFSNMKVDHEGTYSIKIYINDEEVKSLPINIITKK